jgi:hypothetical protein
MMIATSVLVMALLQQVEEASHAEPPIFQVETLLQTAELVSGEERRRFVESALRANAAVRDGASREVYVIRAAHLLLKDDEAEAGRLCRGLTGSAGTRCWIPVDVLEAVRTLSYAGEFKSEASQVLAGRELERGAALLKKWREKMATPVGKRAKLAEAGPEIRRKMDRAEAKEVSEAERSRLLREVLEVSDSIEDPTDRLFHEAVIAAWFAENREEGTAALAAEKLHRTFAAVCRCEDGQCDSIAGRAECSENIGLFAEYLAEKKIDHAALRIRHPSLAARALVVRLKEALK